MKFLETFEKYEEAITFAQAGEFKTAIEFIDGTTRTTEKNSLKKKKK